MSAPDWGSAHLTSDAVVAFVDDELAHGPHERAVAHVAGCPQCAADVVAQRQARSALRSATCPSLPSSLMSALRAIPQDTELPPPPAGLAVTGDGELVSVLRTEPRRAAQAPATRPGAA
ncbi:MAG: zf-HC2 domain-containing protein, partial [Pseudonocardiales bacterium]|nr:zf-HC2 domain-containing protein [Pseudonocardiales bacterium]